MGRPFLTCNLPYASSQENISLGSSTYRDSRIYFFGFVKRKGRWYLFLFFVFVLLFLAQAFHPFPHGFSGENTVHACYQTLFRPKKGALPTADLSNSISWWCQYPGMRGYTLHVP
jgi:hypothetical protein